MEAAPAPGTAKTVSKVFLAFILVTTITGVGVSFQFRDPPVIEASAARIIFAVFILTSLVEIAVARGVIRQAASTGEDAGFLTASILANAFSSAIAVYGLVIGVLSGNWYFALPLGLLAMPAWRILHNAALQSFEANADPYRFRSDA